LRRDAAKAKDFYEKHNCVVMFNALRGMAGWPDYRQRLKLTIDTYHKFGDPILYYINTAEKTLDIAMMNLKFASITQALQSALKRGVAVRMVLFHDAMHQDPDIERLRKSGAEVTYFVTQDREAILHFKYVIKDYNPKDGTGYLVLGSLNWTESGTQHNYEDLVFTSNSSMVKGFHDNYEEIWDYLQHESITNPLVHAILNEDNL